ncbi:MAG: adenosine deaminase [bacterium]|nr:adenosine deaminase [bacterium]
MNLYNELPKAELHLHLRGAMPARVFLGQLKKYPPNDILKEVPRERRDIYLGNPRVRSFLKRAIYSERDIDDLFTYSDFENFLNTWSFTGAFFRDREDLQTLISGVIADLKRQNIVYAEVTISVLEYVRNGIPLDEIAACLEKTRDTPGINVNWIADLLRNQGPEAGLEMLERIIALKSEAFVGITIGGNEGLDPARLFKGVYQRARDAGLCTSAHAGEGAGAESVWEAVRMLGSDRIGHGVRAIEDKALVEYLAENGIPLEVCPTSNIRTGIYESLAEHPLKRLYDAGVPITVNTDDPTFFGCKLADEYRALLDIGFAQSDVYRIIENGFKYAFMTREEIETYLSDLGEIYSDAPRDANIE